MKTTIMNTLRNKAVIAKGKGVIQREMKKEKKERRKVYSLFLLERTLKKITFCNHLRWSLSRGILNFLICENK